MQLAVICSRSFAVETDQSEAHVNRIFEIGFLFSAFTGCVAVQYLLLGCRLADLNLHVYQAPLFPFAANLQAKDRIPAIAGYFTNHDDFVTSNMHAQMSACNFFRGQ